MLQKQSHKGVWQYRYFKVGAHRNVMVAPLPACVLPVSQMNNQFLNYYANAKSLDVLGSINLAEVASVEGIDTDAGWLELRFKVCASARWLGTEGVAMLSLPAGRRPDVQHSHRAALVRLARSA